MNWLYLVGGIVLGGGIAFALACYVISRPWR